MDDLTEGIAKGFYRAVGYILAEIFFGTICYWVGWPICKIFTLGKYPSSNDFVYLDGGWGSARKSNFWCSVVGLLALILIALFLSGELPI